MNRTVLLGLLFVALQASRLSQAQEQQWVPLDQKFAHYHDADLEKVRTTIVTLNPDAIMARNRQFGNSNALILNELTRQVALYTNSMQADKNGYLAQHSTGPDVDAVFALIDSDAPDQVPSLAINPWLKAYIKDRWLLISTQAMARVVNRESTLLEGQVKKPVQPASESTK